MEKEREEPRACGTLVAIWLSQVCPYEAKHQV